MTTFQQFLEKKDWHPDTKEYMEKQLPKHTGSTRAQKAIMKIRDEGPDPVEDKPKPNTRAQRKSDEVDDYNEYGSGFLDKIDMEDRVDRYITKPNHIRDWKGGVGDTDPHMGKKHQRTKQARRKGFLSRKSVNKKLRG